MKTLRSILELDPNPITKHAGEDDQGTPFAHCLLKIEEYSIYDMLACLLKQVLVLYFIITGIIISINIVIEDSILDSMFWEFLVSSILSSIALSWIGMH